MKFAASGWIVGTIVRIAKFGEKNMAKMTAKDDFFKNLNKEQNKMKCHDGKLFTWWRKNRHKIFRVILFPIFIILRAIAKYQNKKYESYAFSEEYCKKCIDKILPKVIIHYKKDPNCFLISDCDYLWSIQFEHLYGRISFVAMHGCKKAMKFTNRFWRETKKYIIEKYQIDGYNKMVLTNNTEWNEAGDRFNQLDIPYDCDGYTGVVFYREGYNEV